MESAASAVATANATLHRSYTADNASLLASGLHEAGSQSLIDADAANWAMGESGTRSFGYSRDWGTQEINHLFGAHNAKGMDSATQVTVISNILLLVVARSYSRAITDSVLILFDRCSQVDPLLMGKKFLVSAACTRRHGSQLVGRGCGICVVCKRGLAWFLGNSRCGSCGVGQSTAIVSIFCWQFVSFTAPCGY